MENNYKAYFNAVQTQYGGHLFVFGWTNSPRFKPGLARSGDHDFNFSLTESSNPSTEVITPFQISKSFSGQPKSINVRVVGEDIQIQAYGASGVGSGENTAAAWVEVGKAK